MIFLLLLGLSSLPYKSTAEKLKSAQNSLSKAKDTQKKVANDSKALIGALAAVKVENPKEIKPVSELYSQLGYDIRVVPDTYGVTVRSFRMNTQIQTETDLANIGQQFSKAKKLKYVSVVIEGNFSEYEQFKKFLHWFDDYTMSISSLEVKRNTFTLILDIYGN